MRNRDRFIASALAGVALLTSAGAYAFQRGVRWHAPADGPATGAGGIYYTGSVTDWGLTCAHCHINNKNQQGQIDVTITPNPAWQNVNNQKGYKPGQTYDLTVTMTGEHLGNSATMKNANGMALSIEDAGGKVRGVFTSDTPGNSGNACPANYPAQDPPAPATTYVYGDCHGVLSIQRNNGPITWTFKWTAPGAGIGPLTVFYGAVDGDSNDGTSLNDDVKVGTVKLVEGN